MRRVFLGAVAVGLCGAWAVPAFAAPACDPAMQPVAYGECLSAAEKQSSAGLDGLVQQAINSIATRPGVYDTQRSMWKNALASSENVWLRFRNEECQEVAPFEGQSKETNAAKNRVAAFQARLLCIIRMNDARSADIATRYPAN